jgi:hypothetical protein
MNTVVSSPVENFEVVVPTKATKPKKLSAKYEKFLVFGYCFIEQLKQQNIAVDETALHQLLTMFSSVEEQTQYFEAFFEQLKASTKSMKAVIKEHNKPPSKSKKTKKEPTDKPVAAKKTNGRKKKNAEVINDKQDELVAELVAAAQTEELPVDDKPKRKYSRKPKTKAVEEPAQEPTQEPIAVEHSVAVVLDNALASIKEPLVDKPKKKTTKKDTEIKPKEAKETKPKETKAKKTKKAEEPVKETFIEPSPILEDADKEEEEEEEIQVQTFLHKGIHYLRDFNNNIYDKNTCEVIGLYDPSTDAITLTKN